MAKKEAKTDFWVSNICVDDEDDDEYEDDEDEDS